MPGYAPPSATTPRPERDDAPVVRETQLGVLHLPAAVRQRHHVFGARLGPFHRALEPTRERGRDDVLAVEVQLGAEPAADRGRDHPHLLGFEAQCPGQRITDAMRGLGRDRHHECAVGLGLGEHAVGLHGNGCDALVHEAAFDDDVGAVEDRRILAEVELDDEVGAVIGEQQRGVFGECCFGIDHRGERLVVDDHAFSGVDGLGAGLGNDGGDDVADEPHDAASQGRAVECRRQHDEAVHVVEAEGLVGGHRDHARHLLGVAGVDSHELRVRHRRPHEGDVQCSRRREVVDVLRVTSEESRVLESTDGVPEDGAGSRHGRACYAPGCQSPHGTLTSCRLQLAVTATTRRER